MEDGNAHGGVSADDGLSLTGRVVVVTGAAGGIGRALSAEFAREQVRVIVAVDRDTAALSHLPEAVDGSSTAIVLRDCDVRDAAALEQLVRSVEEEFGRIDVFCSNAGVLADGGLDAPDADWATSWEVNVLAHVRAARLVLPAMLARGEGALLQTLSAAGLLSAPDSAAYTVTKHAALGFAEWLAITYAQQGIAVCAVCPEAVDTPMLRDSLAQSGGSLERITRAGGVLSPEQVAAIAVRSLQDKRFLVTTHEHTLRQVQRKWADVDAWVGAMGSLVGGRSN